MKAMDKITDTMVALNPAMPRERAHRKASEMGRGIIFLCIGAFFLLMGFGLAIVPIVVLKATPSVWILALAAVSAVPGGYFLLAGGNLISRDAMEAAEYSGGIITRTVSRALKPTRKNTPIPPPDA